MNSDLLFITIFNFRPVDVHSVGDLSVKILTERSQDFKLEDLWVSICVWMEHCQVLDKGVLWIPSSDVLSEFERSCEG